MANSSGRVDSPRSGVPRWVKAFGLAAVALLAIFVLVHVTGSFGHHGMHAGMGVGPIKMSSHP